MIPFFLISENSNFYYRHTGINKKISRDDDHDIWYYDFLKSGKLYELDVDQDEANNHQLTVFVNCRILNDEGELLGVTGVGITMDKIQEMLGLYEQEYDLNAFLINNEGIIQAHTDLSKIEKVNYFTDELAAKEADLLLEMVKKLRDNKIESGVVKFEDGVERYNILRYIEEFDWYLIVEKDISVLQESFRKMFSRDLLIMLIVVIIVLFVVNRLVINYQKQLLFIAETDQTAKIANRRSFENKLEKSIERYEQGKEGFAAFIFDIDHFKKINDQHGHQAGDEVLLKVATIAREIFDKPDFVARWGGDEFAGMIFAVKEEALERLNQLREKIRADEELKKYELTISAGISEICKEDSLDSLMKRADKALYEAKQTGRNRIVEK